MIALLAVAVVAGALGVGIGRATSSTPKAAPPTTVAQRGSTPPTSAPPPSTTSTSTTSTSTSTTSTSTSTTVAVASPSGGAGAFAGEWSVHVTLLTIDATGYGILSWRTYATCGQDPPPCDIFSGTDIIDGGNATMTLAATGSTMAAGRVLTTTVPGKVPLGAFTARVDPAKDLLYLSLPMFATYPLCGTRARALPVGQQKAEGINCGA